MANICDTQYKVMGERKAVTDLWNTLQAMEVNTNQGESGCFRMNESSIFLS